MRKQIDIYQAVGKKLVHAAESQDGTEMLLAFDDDFFVVLSAVLHSEGEDGISIESDGAYATFNRRTYRTDDLIEIFGYQVASKWFDEDEKKQEKARQHQERHERRLLAELKAKYEGDNGNG